VIINRNIFIEDFVNLKISKYTIINSRNSEKLEIEKNIEKNAYTLLDPRNSKNLKLKKISKKCLS